VNAELIVRALRGGRDTQRLINEDAGALTERIVTRSGVPGYREEIARYLVEVYAALDATLSREHDLRVSAQLDGAEARSHWTVLCRLLGDLAAQPDLPESMRERVQAALAEHAAPSHIVETL